MTHVKTRSLILHVIAIALAATAIAAATLHAVSANTVVVEDAPCTLGGSTILNGDSIRAYATSTTACGMPDNSIIRNCISGTLDDSSGTGSFVYDTCTAADLTASSVTSDIGGPPVASPGEAVLLRANFIDLNYDTSGGSGGAVSNDPGSPVNLRRDFTYIYEQTNGPDGTGTITERFSSPFLVSHAIVGAQYDYGPTSSVVQYSVFADPGIHSVRYCADQSADPDATTVWDEPMHNVIPETDETNNCGPWTNVTVSNESCTLGGSTIPNGQSIRAYASNDRACGDPANSIVRNCVAGTLDDSSGTGAFVNDTCTSADLTFEPATNLFGGPITATPGEMTYFQAAPIDLNQDSDPDSLYVGGARSNEPRWPVRLSRWTHFLYEVASGPDGTGTVQQYAPELIDTIVRFTGRNAAGDRTLNYPVFYAAGRIGDGINTDFAAVDKANGHVFDTAGTYSVRFCADQHIDSQHDDLLPETDETNNCGPWSNVAVTDAVCTLGGSTINNGDSIRAFASSTNACGDPANSVVRTCVNGTLDDPSSTGSFVHDTCASNDLSFTAPTSMIGGDIVATPGEEIEFEAIVVDLNAPANTNAVGADRIGGAVSNDPYSPVPHDRPFGYLVEIVNGAGATEKIGPDRPINRYWQNYSWVSGRYTFPAAGTYSVRFCADQTVNETNGEGVKINNVIPETDETNNCGPYATVVIEPECPESASPVPSSPCFDDDVNDTPFAPSVRIDTTDNQYVVEKGDTKTIWWDSQGWYDAANNCTLSPNDLSPYDTGDLAAGEASKTITGLTTYTYTCTDPDNNYVDSERSDTLTLRVSECSDEIDNDGDGNIDYPDDPSCSSPLHDDESNVVPPELTANPRLVRAGKDSSDDVTLTWTLNGNEGCQLSSNTGFGAVTSDGSGLVEDISSTQTYTVTCDGGMTGEVTVQVLPQIFES